jgi:hypothetical protein
MGPADQAKRRDGRARDRKLALKVTPSHIPSRNRSSETMSMDESDFYTAVQEKASLSSAENARAASQAVFTTLCDASPSAKQRT